MRPGDSGRGIGHLRRVCRFDWRCSALQLASAFCRFSSSVTYPSELLCPQDRLSALLEACQTGNWHSVAHNLIDDLCMKREDQGMQCRQSHSRLIRLARTRRTDKSSDTRLEQPFIDLDVLKPLITRSLALFCSEGEAAVRIRPEYPVNDSFQRSCGLPTVDWC